VFAFSRPRYLLLRAGARRGDVHPLWPPRLPALHGRLGAGAVPSLHERTGIANLLALPPDRLALPPDRLALPPDPLALPASPVVPPVRCRRRLGGGRDATQRWGSWCACRRSTTSWPSSCTGSRPTARCRRCSPATTSRGAAELAGAVVLTPLRLQRAPLERRCRLSSSRALPAHTCAPPPAMAQVVRKLTDHVEVLHQDVLTEHADTSTGPTTTAPNDGGGPAPATQEAGA
jgi:hypothetical protein